MSYEPQHRYREGSTDGSQAAPVSLPWPGKRTLTQSMSRRDPPVERPVQAKADVTAGLVLSRPSVQDAAADGTASAGTSLPFFAEIQRSFGRHDVSDIVAHAGDRAAHAAGAMGAVGYATGNHVAFAGAPTLHTAAHEAAHVIQQRAGVHLEGGVGQVGDDYERHADAVADRVVAGLSAEDLLDAHATASPSAAPPGHVQRQVAAQLTMKGDTTTIANVIIVGRPESPHSGGTMGDHTTAFVLHVEAIRSRLIGQPVTAAMESLDALVMSLGALPGLLLVDELPEYWKGMLKAAESRLQAARTSATSHPDGEDLALDLQELISAYLAFRELVPLSTINVRAKTSDGGKGHGERANVVSDLEELTDLETTKNAVVRLFDGQAAARVAIEPDIEVLATMAPGLDPALGYRDRIAPLVAQHVATVESAFPNAFGAEPDAVRGPVTDAVMDEVLERLPALWRKELTSWQKAVRVNSDNLVKYRGELGRLRGEKGRSKAAQETAQDEIYKAAEGLQHATRMVAIVTKAFAAATADAVAKAEASASKREDKEAAEGEAMITEEPKQPDDREPTSDDEVPVEAITDTKADEIAVGEDLSGKDTKVEASDGIEGAEGEAVDEATIPGTEADVTADDESNQPLAIQLVLDEKRQIRDLYSAGRPPSPFAGTMGAHTTAWVVHVDRVRAALRGKDVPTAATTLSTLLKEARAMRDALAETTFDNACDDGQATEQEKVASTAVERAGAATKNQSLLVQTAINALLTFINVIPGVTLRKIRTAGNGEGTYRGTLVQAEAVLAERALRASDEAATTEDPPSESVVALCVFKLLDVSRVPEAQRAVLFASHMKMIEDTYPHAYEYAAELLTLENYYPLQHQAKKDKAREKKQREALARARRKARAMEAITAPVKRDREDSDDGRDDADEDDGGRKHAKHDETADAPFLFDFALFRARPSAPELEMPPLEAMHEEADVDEVAMDGV